MRPPLFLRYLRLLGWYSEARLGYLLSRALADILNLLWIGAAVFVALLCLSAALLVALQKILGLSLAFLITGLLWVMLTFVNASLFRSWLYRRFQVGRHAYRATLARAGLRLMEKHFAPQATSPSPLAYPFFSAALPLLLRWLGSWLRGRIRRFLCKILPL